MLETTYDAAVSAAAREVIAKLRAENARDAVTDCADAIRTLKKAATNG